MNEEDVISQGVAKHRRYNDFKYRINCGCPGSDCEEFFDISVFVEDVDKKVYPYLVFNLETDTVWESKNVHWEDKWYMKFWVSFKDRFKIALKIIIFGRLRSCQCFEFYDVAHIDNIIHAFKDKKKEMLDRRKTFDEDYKKEEKDRKNFIKDMLDYKKAKEISKSCVGCDKDGKS